MAITRTTVNQTGDAGLSVDMNDRATQLYVGAAVVGGSVIVASVGLTAAAAPALVLAPTAVAVGLAATGRHIQNDDGTAPAKRVPTPAVEIDHSNLVVGDPGHATI